MRLAIDLGYSSIGWSLLSLSSNKEKPGSLIDLGTVIFDNGRAPRGGEPKNIARREFRQARRQKKRREWRQEKLIRHLVSFGMLPKNKTERMALNVLDPYPLRARAATPGEQLTAHEFGRVLLHLAKRRGFKSNRKSASKDEGAMKMGIAALVSDLERSGHRTLGQYLAQRHAAGKPTRMRPITKGNTNYYDLFVSREMVESEFEVIWENQAAHLGLTEGQRKTIHHDIFFQRSLVPVKPGRCSCDPDEDRGPLAHLLAQRYRILADLGNLRLIDDEGKRPLNLDERDILYRELLLKEKVTFDRMRRLLKNDAVFNLESDKRKDLKGCLVSHALSHKKCFGAAWHKLDLQIQQEIVDRLLLEEDKDNLLAWLRASFDLTEEQAQAICDANLPSGYGSFSVKALERIVPLMEKRTIFDEEQGFDRYLRADEAIAKAGYRPGTAPRTKGGLDALPYYGELLSHRIGTGTGNPEDAPEIRYGKIANPSVHIALNQLRRLVNDIIDRYGKPSEIVIELSRDAPKGTKEREEIDRRQARQQKHNEAIRKKLIAANIEPSRANIRRYRLWEELGSGDEWGRRTCVYTGARITLKMAMSNQTQVDHILPRSRFLDNSMGNLILCMARANQIKKNRTPYEAWGGTKEWKGIVARCKALPGNKAQRILATSPEDALLDEHLPERLLNDTRYISKIAREYLSHLCASPEDIWCTNGNMTALLRSSWGLNDILSEDGRKNRNDHRHHAIDAVVIGLTDRKMIEQAARMADRREQDGGKLIGFIPEPWKGFREEVEKAVQRMVVYHKPNHGISGALVEATNYGRPRKPEPEYEGHLVHRQELDSLSESQIARIKDKNIRESLQAAISAARTSGDGKKDKEIVREGIEAFRNSNPVFARIRRVQVYEKSNTAIEVGPPGGRRIVVPGSNHRIELWQCADGSRQVFSIQMVDAAKGKQIVPNQPHEGHVPVKKLLTLHKNDLFLYRDDTGAKRVMRVVAIDPAGSRIKAAGHNEAGDLNARHKSDTDPFRWTFVNFARISGGQVSRVWMRPSGIVGDKNVMRMAA